MKKNKSIILTIVAVATLVALAVGATYAYFQATGGVGSSSKVNVETATTDLLTFNFSKSIAIYADQSNFGKGAGNQSDSTKGTATLTASNSANIASTTDRYNIYFIIDSNDFVYTTSDNKTELLLQVTDPNDNEVTAIDGLLYKDGGFDITTRTGGFLLVPDYDISASRGETTTQEWNITVTLVNLDTDQSDNMGKTFSGKVYMTKDQMSSYELTQISNMNVTTTYNSIDATLEVTNGSAEITKYYFGNEKLTSDTTSMLLINKLGLSDVTFVETTNPNYKFTNLDANSTYKIYSYAVDKNGIKSNMYETEVKTDKYVIPTVDSVTHTSTLNSITVNVTASKGSNEIAKYFYSKDDGATYVESNESSYTFTDLADTAEYKIKIKVEDTDGKFSTVYSESINTVTYVLPSITTVTPTTKYNQIMVATTATGGTNNVSKYYYSINNGAYVEDGTFHTFTGLTEQTTYTIKIKVVDTNERESVVYETSTKTDAYELPTVTIAFTSSTYNSITINLTGTNGDGTITEYYYSKDNGSNYVKGTSSSYTFTNLTSNATFNVKVYVKDSNGRSSSVVSTIVKTSGPLLANWVKSQYTGTQGDNNLYYHDSTLANGAGDNSYRYAGSSDTTNNFVCFGSDAATCPDDNLYRIIGVFGDQVKLIKWDYVTSTLLGTDGGYVNTYSFGGTTKGTNATTSIGVYFWNSTGTNTWSASELNTVNLNTNYLNNIGTEWASKIATTTWKVGGNTYANIQNTTAANAYQNEYVNPAESTTEIKKIGLMYTSDYGFAASPSAWTAILNTYNSYINDNWMYMGLAEWTVVRRSDITYYSFLVTYAGDVGYSTVGSVSFAVRPVFHLESSVSYVSGDGTKTNPIILSENSDNISLIDKQSIYKV